ncbi:hypothetical protein COY33_00340 [candidate division WWE3 bacterium CG_4_10_14_0_2_um_filter_42_7]|uniref:Uncharacterized protein n=2 Tax=Katanobacteria TaxID=422282 RepID=A0A2H0XA96_UNCKA|nr:MAG: hypothetical protein COT51_01010 [candidate division WWE3 bacterium CG08_land_8_20_14_0_20_41_15]PIZ44047.1 MAG: hypothetical protein COY33_00340 [candidate division WWE3 bacterium CG_4_10_14_0_2_um_filter_42_7]
MIGAASLVRNPSEIQKIIVSLPPAELESLIADLREAYDKMDAHPVISSIRISSLKRAVVPCEIPWIIGEAQQQLQYPKVRVG